MRKMNGNYFDGLISKKNEKWKYLCLNLLLIVVCVFFVNLDYLQANNQNLNRCVSDVRHDIDRAEELFTLNVDNYESVVQKLYNEGYINELTRNNTINNIEFHIMNSNEDVGDKELSFLKMIPIDELYEIYSFRTLMLSENKENVCKNYDENAKCTNFNKLLKSSSSSLTSNDQIEDLNNDNEEISMNSYYKNSFCDCSSSFTTLSPYNQLTKSLKRLLNVKKLKSDTIEELKNGNRFKFLKNDAKFNELLNFLVDDNGIFGKNYAMLKMIDFYFHFYREEIKSFLSNVDQFETYKQFCESLSTDQRMNEYDWLCSEKNLEKLYYYFNLFTCF
jgi:hypothetical protein